jgi:Bacteriophage coat protein B.
MLKKFKGKLYAMAPAASLVLVAPAAFASGGGGVDVSGVVSAIEGAAAPIAAIGSAVLLVLVGIKVYKWVRRAM